MNTLSIDTQQRIFRTLGEGVVKVWSGMPPAIQHELFEAAVRAEGESLRPQLAIFLHGMHLRTTDAIKARAMPEPLMRSW